MSSSAASSSHGAKVESNDYPTYIANLREIGCQNAAGDPRLIIADVNALYARKRATEIVTPEQQWWRSEPDTNIFQIAAARLRDLDEERRALLTELLGPNWDRRSGQPAPAFADGRCAGRPGAGLADGRHQEGRPANRPPFGGSIQAYTEAQRAAGKLVDPAEIARMRQQATGTGPVHLARTLEEFELRYSQNSNALRGELGQLKYFNATPDEFRAMFRATDGYDLQLQMLAGRPTRTVFSNGRHSKTNA